MIHNVVVLVIGTGLHNVLFRVNVVYYNALCYTVDGINEGTLRDAAS